MLTRRDILPFDLSLYDVLGPLLGVALPAFVVVAASGAGGVRELASRCWRWRVRLRWYVFALLSVPAAVCCAPAHLSVVRCSLCLRIAGCCCSPQLVLLIVCCIVAEEVGLMGFL